MARMSPAEMVWRARDQLVRMAWSGRQVTREQLAQTAQPVPAGGLRFTAVLPAGTAASAGPADDCHVDKIGEDIAEEGLKFLQEVNFAERRDELLAAE